MIDNAYAKGQKLLCGGYSEYTPTGKSYFVTAGRWGTVPKLGSVVYFYSQDMGRVSHVGAVVVNVDTKNKLFTTVEGNTSSTEYSRNGGCVAKHTYSYTNVGGKNRVNGFGYPLFSDDTCTAEEFVAVLLEEVGYLEKATNAQLDSKTANAGSNNYTKYGKWYGDNGAYWCQQFISWCAYTACKRHLEKAKTGWEKQSDGTWKYSVKGKYLNDTWMEIGGRWYVFIGDGTMVTGWFGSDADEWYYLNPDDGAMLSGQWFKVKNVWYYATKTGETAKNVYVKSTTPNVYCWCGADGSWEQKWDTTSPDLIKYGLAE